MSSMVVAVGLSETNQHQSSFRDPAGFVFEHSGKIYRQVSHEGAQDYELLMQSGLYEELVARNLMVGHQELQDKNKFKPHKKRYKIICPEQIPFISYPYEWSAAQLKDAALLTLQIQRLALNHGMILKDASAYNVQFVGRRPIFIDTLSFWKYSSGEPWEGYQQFCEHFITPLALAAYVSPEILLALRVYINGIPLQLGKKMLPARARLQGGILSHIYLNTPAKNKLNKLINDLEKAVRQIPLPKSTLPPYSAPLPATLKATQQVVGGLKPAPKIIWDLNAQNGSASELAAKMSSYVISFNQNWAAAMQAYRNNDGLNENILPLVQDMASPSPALGWAHSERHSLEDRGPADVALALDLLPYLAVINHSPFSRIAEYFSDLSQHLIIEFIPKDDPAMQKLLAAFSRNKFEGYTAANFEQAFAKYFTLLERKAVKDCKRVLYFYKAKVKK